jgi:hypothetical protein
MRDQEVIDSEFQLLAAVRRSIREEEGRPPSTAHIDELLDERSAAAFSGSEHRKGTWPRNG